MISMFNTGYDLQDQLDGVKNGIAIVSTGDTHIAITSGQYVYIQDHSTLAEGLYRATANIAANATLSGSNVTAVSGGGLNALNSNITKTAINTGIAGITAYKASNIVILHLQISTAISGGTTSGWVVIGTLPQELYPPRMVYGIVCDNNATGRSNLPLQVNISTTGEMKVYLYANESAKLYGEIVY